MTIHSLDLQHIRVLIADSSDYFQSTMLGILHAFGARHVSVAGSGADALDRSRRDVTDLLICDWGLPGIDGFDLVKRIRSDGDNPNRYTPVIVLTSHAQSDNVVRARDCGANIVLAKPFSPKALFLRLQWLTEDPRPFVIAPGYVGPDRRFKAGDPPPSQSERRHDRQAVAPARQAQMAPAAQMAMA